MRISSSLSSTLWRAGLLHVRVLMGSSSSSSSSTIDGGEVVVVQLQHM
jgi:hypothetical protein|eukprot:COSAG06_NODE_988_length_11185_cov_2.942089_6_plen_48_part_00